MPGGGPRYTPQDIKVFLEALEEGATFMAAVRAAGLTKSGVYQHLDRHPALKKRVEKIRGRKRGKVEAALFLAATTPDDKGRYNERAQIFYLKNIAPADWSDRRDISITEHDDMDEEVLGSVSEEAREELREAARRVLLKRGRPETQKLH